ncbi:hypothetical protein A4X06_0g8414 [Tilletia controversa]|uniref:Uncharacterized protein n=1 Tax=Tilletia controversa TaxID=13291 RepID=A0A8X7SST1_9BASI|nr:hypothetical protein CF335_g9668 [Tilletia laevis]KAE8239255.1 hypothetical protein A4X06_0g8414 [Tilletia controversa]
MPQIDILVGANTIPNLLRGRSTSNKQIQGISERVVLDNLLCFVLGFRNRVGRLGQIDEMFGSRKVGLLLLQSLGTTCLGSSNRSALPFETFRFSLGFLRSLLVDIELGSNGLFGSQTMLFAKAFATTQRGSESGRIL